jgi:uncharacterized membrane protein YcaP (DUF421 family)
MDSVMRGAVTYLVVWLIFRVAGKRSLGEISTFDFVLLLILSETVQQALLGDDNSMTNAVLLIVTMLGIDIALSLWKGVSARATRLIEGVPLVLMADGVVFSDRMRKARVDEEDVLAAARQSRGLARLDQIKYAVLECNGAISIIPRNEQTSVPRRRRRRRTAS